MEYCFGNAEVCCLYFLYLSFSPSWIFPFLSFRVYFFVNLPFLLLSSLGFLMFLLDPPSSAYGHVLPGWCCPRVTCILQCFFFWLLFLIFEFDFRYLVSVLGIRVRYRLLISLGGGWGGECWCGGSTLPFCGRGA